MACRRGLLIVFVAGAACALPSAGEFATGRVDGPSDAGPDGTTSASFDGSTGAKDGETIVPNDAAVDAFMPPIVNLLSKNNADFEAGNCDDSGNYESELTGSDGAQAGSFACKVCRAPGSPTTDIWSIDNGFNVSPQVGQEYRATVWVRRPPGASDALAVHVVLRSQTNNYMKVEENESPPTVLTDAWQQLSVSLPITKPAKHMDTYTYAENAASLVVPCFLVDDWVVWLAN